MSVSQRHQTTGCGSRFNFQLSFAHPRVATPTPNSSVVELRQNIVLHSSFEAYEWVDGLQVWGAGTADLSAQEARVKVWVA